MVADYGHVITIANTIMVVAILVAVIGYVASRFCKSKNNIFVYSLLVSLDITVINLCFAALWMFL